ncbi:signal peptidase II [uncultured Eubacterium sp.]|mgnify:FL=1|uniref:signal peptidase II n=1 Tax=uncultured Eubacterium sp. TaxID=165185 RepID=UPI0025D91A63|nr:signal peptidase II [uncultured Eubacterium sp.]
MKHTKKHISCTIMIILIVAFDQITKYFASLKLADGSVAKFIPGVVQFKYAENTGMAFSMLSGARWVFIALTVVVCVGVFYYLFSNRCKNLWLYWSLGVILSGGIGNLIDRIRFGYVVDFIEPTFVNFAIFNIADCAVTCGAVVLVGYLLYDAFKDVKKPKENSDG